MPGTSFTTQERERLAGFPEDIPHWDLITYCTLTEHDRALIDTYHGDANRLGTALQLCAVHYLGFCPADLQAAPAAMVAFLARFLHVNPTALQTYGRRRMTRGTHFNAILHHLGFRRVQPEDRASMLTWLTERALEHDTPTLLFQTVCEHLKQQHILRPAVTTVERWVVTARLQAHEESLHRLQPLLTRDRIALLDRCLVPEPDTGKTPLYWLRQHATSNTPPALLDALSKLSLLQQWEVDQWEMSALNPNRQKFLARLGRKYTVQALRRMGPERRYPILLSFLKQTFSDLTDESVDIFDVCLTSRHKKAREALKDYQDKIAETVGTHSQLLQTIGDLVLDEAIHDDHLRQAIYHAIPRVTLQAAVKEAHRLRRPNGYFDFLDDQYSYVRQFAPQLLGEGSEIPDPPLNDAIDTHGEGSDCSDPQGSDISDGGSQNALTHKTRENHDHNTGVPAIAITQRPDHPPASAVPKAERHSPFWCPACEYATPTCRHRVIHAPPPARPRAHPAPPWRRP